MKARFTLIVLLIATILFFAFSGNPPNGKTGAPGENTCTQCHTSTNPSFDGTFEIMGLPTDALGGNTYTVTVLTTDLNLNAVRAGFQITALDSDDNAIGTFANASAGSTVTESGGRIYHEHMPAQNFSAGTASWSVDWTLPTTGIPDNEMITFYGASVIGNGSGSSNDLVITDVVTTIYDAPVISLTVDIIDNADPLCFDELNGTATAVPTGGMEPYMYSWSNGETDAVAILLPSGTSSVTVTDNLGATNSASVMLENPDEISDNLINIENVDCFGQSTGNIFTNPAGGTGTLTYLWSTGSTDKDLINSPAGTYTLTISDQNQCSVIFEYEITEPNSAFSVNINETESIECSGFSGSLLAIPSNNISAVIWNNGVTSLANPGIVAGNYSVTVTDQNGCTASDSYLLDEPEMIELTFDITNPSMGSDGSVTVNPTGGTPLYNFLWSNGEMTPTISNLPGGNYTVTVTDANNCQVMETITLTNGCSLTLIDTIFSTNICFGDSTGEIGVIVVGNMGDVNYLWSNGDTTNSINNLIAGTYDVIVTDSAGCTAETSIEVTEPLEIEIDFEVGDDNSQIDSVGYILTSITNGVNPLSYLWSNGANTNNITNLSPGLYSLTVTDATGCIQIDSVNVKTIDCILDVSLNINDGLCAGDSSSVELIINDSYGDLFIQYLPIGTDPNNLAAGEYSVYVRDSIQCTDTIEFTIESIESLEIDLVEIINPSCEDSLGSLEIIVSGGTAPYDISWSSGDTTELVDSLLEGIYTVLIEDANGCSIDSSFELIKLISGEIIFDISIIEIYLDESGNYNDIPDLDPFTNQLIGSCEDSLYLVIDTIEVDCDNLFDTMQTDIVLFNFNEAIDTIEVDFVAVDTIPPTMKCFVLESQNYEVCGSIDITINIDLESLGLEDNCGAEFTDETEIFVFTINESDTIFIEITAVDLSGNTVSCFLESIITVYEVPQATSVELIEPSCFGESDGCIILNIEGGTAPYSVDTMCNLTAGDYEITYTDINGCGETLDITLNQPDILVITIEDKGDESAPGESDGFINVNITGGVPPYSFSWTENGQEVSNLEDLVNFPSSQYTLTVEDSTGCSAILNSFIDIFNSTSNVDIEEVKIMPIPFNNSLIIKELKQDMNVEIFNVLGQSMTQLTNKNIANQSINTSDWNSGIYFAHIRQNGAYKTIKLIKP